MEPLPEDSGEESVILISDDEADCTQGTSVIFVEPSEKSSLEEKKCEEVVDAECELLVTFCKQGDVMPHARYDCPEHPFERAECDTSSPLKRNADICSQCYCYICDKLASECQNWTAPSFCHSNAHNKSKFWKEQRDFALVGVLVMFNLDLTDIDADLRRGGKGCALKLSQNETSNEKVIFVSKAKKCLQFFFPPSSPGSLLIKFIHKLSAEYNKYLLGERMLSNRHECFCYTKLAPGQCNICLQRQTEVIYRYSAVFTLVMNFLNEADQENPKTAAVMLLGAAKEIALHKDPSLWRNLGQNGSLKVAVPCLMERITTRLQRMLVLCDFPNTLHHKFIHFFQRISLPCHCYTFSNCLNVMPWDHGLLTTVLKGQNITGQRTHKGRKVSLWEAFPVIRARVERLENQQHYKEIVRYLKAVKCNDTQGLKIYKDRIPFYLCKMGDFVDAARSLFLPYSNLACCTACRITSAQFEVYMKMFKTGSVPSGNDLRDSGQWTAIGSPLKNTVLITRGLKLLYSNTLLYRNPKCWSTFIMVLGSGTTLEKSGHLIPLSLKEPPLDFQEKVVSVCYGLLNELKTKVNVSLPCNFFSNSFCLEAGLILLVQAVKQMILSDLPYLNSILEIILAFGNNFWALRLLLDGFSYEESILHGTVNLFVRDLNCRKDTILTLGQTVGPQYVGALLCEFLTCTNVKMQSIGVFIIQIITEKLHMCPWAKQLFNVFVNKGLRTLPLGPPVDGEVAKFMAVLESL
ncbi:uncharacterized protein LOC102368867 isoform X2 [Alligator sinensis]|uniref:Uncharacterized protein LOC102368867 isoform X2 n=1 Tax=Alligator sinensis TaxID=38654 RepID=A0A3Q0GQI5_ALLSI|nr:uncharacterized protein LOC102368867 isoform X2 [Alligator sinensis]